MTANSHRVAFAAAGVALFTSCFFSFGNPVDPQSNGSIGGSVTLQGTTASQTLKGGSITVLWSNLTYDFDYGLLTAPFAFLSLPDGTYTLLYGVPDAGPSGFPLEGIRPNVVIASVLGGQSFLPDAVNVGHLTLSAAGIVAGTVTGTNGGATVGAFLPSDGGQLGPFEAIETVTDANGAFSLTLPAGQHTLAASDSLRSGTLNVTVNGGSSQNVSFPVGAPPFGITAGNLTGNLVFGEQGAAASAASLSDFLQEIQIVITDDAGNSVPVPDSGLTQTPEVGAEFSFPVPAGELYTITFTIPGEITTDGGIDYPTFTIGPIPSIAGQGTVLNQVTWLTTQDLLANADAGAFDAGSTSAGTTGGTSGTTGAAGTTSSGTTSGQQGSTTTSGTSSGWSQPNPGFVVDSGIVQVTVVPISNDGGQALVWLANDGNVSSAYNLGLGYENPTLLSGHGSKGPSSFSAAAVDGGLVVAWATTANGNIYATYVPGDGTQNVVLTLPFTAGYLNNAGNYQGVSVFTGTQAGVAGVFLAAPSPDGGILLTFSSDNLTTFAPVTNLGFTPPGGGAYTFANVTGVDCPIVTGGGVCLVGSDLGDQYVVAAAVSTATATPTLVQSQFVTWTGDANDGQLAASLAARANDVAVLVGPPSGTGSNVVEFADLTSLATPPTLIATDDLTLLLTPGNTFLGVGLDSAGLHGDPLFADGGVGTPFNAGGFETGLPILGGYSAGNTAYVAVVNAAGNAIEVLNLSP